MNDLALEEAAIDIEFSGEPCSSRTETGHTSTIVGVRVGMLISLGNNGITPLVTFAGQLGAAAVVARPALRLLDNHVGGEVVLMFEGGDPRKPIVMACLSSPHAWPSSTPPGQVEVDVDGERLSITAKEQLVLRCGNASITLTKAGKVLIQGAYVSSRSSGANRIRGGSVQIN